MERVEMKSEEMKCNENTSNKIIYKDKIFCTVQGVDQTQNEEYTVNKDVYTSDTSYDNDFIIL